MICSNNQLNHLKKQEIFIITVTNRIDPESMPYNEFVLYRNNSEDQFCQKVIVLFETEVNKDVEYPKNLSVYRCGYSFTKLKKTIHDITDECEKKGMQYIFHIHEGKSVLFFNIATFCTFKNSIVYTIHSTFSRYSAHNKAFAVAASLLSRKVVCVSKTSLRYYPLLLKKILKDKVIAIQNGVYSERINRVLDHLPPNSEFDNRIKLHLIYVARMIPSKRQDLLLKALVKIPDAELTLVGDGKQKESLIEMAKQYGMIDRVHFSGVIPRNEVYLQMKYHDVYVSSSSYEGLPISVLEAMSCGVVCAVSDIEQHREIKEKCPSLILVNNTPEDWARVLQSVAEMPLEERERIAKQNKKDVDEHFSLERMHRQYDIVYHEIAEEQHAR